jgi:hypothetical protein
VGHDNGEIRSFKVIDFRDQDGTVGSEHLMPLAFEGLELTEIGL